MESKRKPGRPRTFDRKRTVSLAVEEYWSDGVHGLSVNEVCRRTGLSKPALYREFGGEDGLLTAALESYRSTAIASLDALLTADRTFSEAIEAIAGFVSAASKGCMLVKFRTAPERLGPLAAARVSSIVEEQRARYEAAFVRARARGEVRSDITPRLAGLYLDTQVTNALRQVAMGENPDEVRAQIALALAALLSDEP